MHAEALNWNGLTATHYAVALGISAHSLRRWRDLLEAEDIAIDWRTRLHPSALPKISSGVSSAANQVADTGSLTGEPARLAARRALAKPIDGALRTWLEAQLPHLPGHGKFAKAMR
jgi:hypothetical protein